MSAVLAFQSRTPSAQPKRTVAWVVEWHIKNDVRMKSKIARAERNRLLRLFCDFRTSEGRLLGETPTDECIGADLVEFLNVKAPSGQWSRRRWCGTIKRPFREAAKLGLITHSPFQAVTEKKGPRGRPLSWDEFRALLRLACPAMRRILLALRWCGARPGELRSFEWSHMDAIAGKIVQWEHKTAHTTEEARVILVIQRFARLIAWIKKNHPHGGRYVFVNSYGGQWTTGALCKNLRSLRAKAGLPKDAKLYGCRHAYITEAILNGVDLAIVMELAGHRDIKTTQTYLHLRERPELKEAAEKAFRWGAGEKKGEALLAKLDPVQIQALIDALQGVLAARCASHGS